LFGDVSDDRLSKITVRQVGGEGSGKKNRKTEPRKKKKFGKSKRPGEYASSTLQGKESQHPDRY